ncbi:rod shape-determining protein MreC [Desulfonatronovibrio hydrogenovorans]|uniref:rod shape-determining protein MreC n=1 Tax=Desulfonatronovibrio hydrogenovorans TaxID=53245 RepID=UPI000691ED37|nr:rod shape-determining protein MreC [Desulfonatronovibrio hydrogenovorans]
MTPKKILGLFFIFIVFYLSLYTWNSRTHFLDQLATSTGLEFVGWTVKPGKLIHSGVRDFWDRYVQLMEVHTENQTLRQQVEDLQARVTELNERSAQADRLERLLDFSPPPRWNGQGARVVAHDFGPLGALNSIVIDKGKFQGVTPNLPVVTPDSVVGRTFKTGLNFSTVLLTSDPNSRIPVISSETRVPGILAGQGYSKPFSVQYVHLNSPLQSGELLVTSGLAGIYPKGLPVARVSGILRSEISLFLLVEAEPLADFRTKEEVMILENNSFLKIEKLGFEE